MGTESITRVTIDNGHCDFCGTCVAVCSADAIELKESVIRIDETRCTLCEACIDACPLGVPEGAV